MCQGRRVNLRRLAGLTVMFLLVGGTGCQNMNKHVGPPPQQLPHELDKVIHPEYIVEPPDVLQVDLIAAVPKPPYKVMPLDGLAIRVTNTLPDAPIAGIYTVSPEGAIDLGIPYGSFPVRGKTLEEVRAIIEKQLSETLKKPVVEVNLAQSRAMQQVRGPHLVRPDGTVGLGVYGSVRVVGMSLVEVKRALEAHLSQFFESPEVSIEIAGYNSKVYYVIFDGGGAGQRITRMPITGNETVLDAVGLQSGLTTVSNPKRIWISRPAPAGQGHQVIPIDWKAISECGDPQTNYQLMAGDRIFVQSYDAVKLNTVMSRVLAPVEQALGVGLLGVGLFNFNNGFGGFGQ